MIPILQILILVFSFLLVTISAIIGFWIKKFIADNKESEKMILAKMESLVGSIGIIGANQSSMKTSIEYIEKRIEKHQDMFMAHSIAIEGLKTSVENLRDNSRH
jgi:hypothetical protein